MPHHLRCAGVATSLLLCFFPVSPAVAQSSAPQAAAKSAAPDYSQEAYVVQRLISKVSYENDGTFTEDTVVQVRVQSPAGVQDLGLVRYPYPSSVGDAQILSVRVTKPDGTKVDTPLDGIQDIPEQVTIAAPFYSDLKEKQLAVKGLAVGDVLEYERSFHARTPVTPGQFWFSYSFVSDGISLDEQLEVSVPGDRTVKVKSTTVQPVISQQNGRRIYLWKTNHLARQSEAEKSKEQARDSAEGGSDLVPDVQLTSFRSWDEVAQWYWSLQESRIAPTADIQAKAQELTRGATSDDDKIRLLYNYVSTKFRYIGVGFGIGRYQPHAATDVMNNGYGDCKDKHTLLAALLAASGIKAYPALINSSRKIDPDVPSPMQFDHVITAVPRGKDYLWLDTTAEVGPEGFLVSVLRDKQTLLIPGNGPAALVKTPVTPPFPQSFAFTTEGKIAEDGVLTAQTEIVLRGDAEVALRSGFHQTPQPQWKDIVQNFSQALGFAGMTDNVTVSSPETTNEALTLKYSYTRKDYPQWPDQLGSPLPGVDLDPIAEDDAKVPDMIQILPPGESHLDSRITLPSGVKAILSAPVVIHTDFADYHATYTLDAGVVHVQRVLSVTLRDIPKSRIAEYRKFQKAVNDDENSFMNLDRGSGPILSSSADPADPAEAQRRQQFLQLVRQGTSSERPEDLPAAIKSLQDAVALEPTSADALGVLALLHVMHGDMDQAMTEMQKAMDLTPVSPETLNNIGDALSELHHEDDALKAWKKNIEQFPNDTVAPRNMGSYLLQHQRFEEAAQMLGPAAEKNPKDGRIAFLLGEAYIRSGDADQGVTALDNAVADDSSPAMMNEVAYELADSNVRLDISLRDAQKAVDAIEERTSDISLPLLSENDVRQMPVLAAYWDTLGWVQFRLNHFDVAEKYLAAAWNLSQTGVPANHLAQLYEKQGKKVQAQHFYTLSEATDYTPAKSKLVQLYGSQSAANQAVIKARDELSQLRRIKLPLLTTAQSDGDIFLLLTREDGIESIRVMSGSDGLRAALKAPPKVKVASSFPDDHPVKLVRRAVVYCSPSTRGCDLVLSLPATVDKVN